MRLRRITPPVLAALLVLSGCTTVGGVPSAPPPGLAPAGDRLPSPVRELPAERPAVREHPVPRPAPAREELAGTGRAPAPPPGKEAGRKAPDTPAGQGRRPHPRAEHRPPGGAGYQRPAAPRQRRSSAGGERRAEAPRAKAPRTARPKPAAKRPLPRRSVGMRDLCRASHGVADPSIVSLCHRAYG
ncbi:hypothetical protein [Streptomyces lavendulocolor]|uniref:hypothetical protein n=1 Tax=Streptomyces lavendulocolor TaxID=67316 RepID=UPI003C30B301